MEDMWHNMSHISKTINSAKRIRLGEKSYFHAGLTMGEWEERNEEVQNFLIRSMKFRWSKFVKPRVKIYLLDESYAYVPNQRISSKIQKWRFGEIRFFELWRCSRGLILFYYVSRGRDSSYSS